MTNPGRGADDSTLAQFDKILTDAQSIFDRMNPRVAGSPHAHGRGAAGRRPACRCRRFGCTARCLRSLRGTPPGLLDGQIVSHCTVSPSGMGNAVTDLGHPFMNFHRRLSDQVGVMASHQEPPERAPSQCVTRCPDGVGDELRVRKGDGPEVSRFVLDDRHNVERLQTEPILAMSGS
jgi:hypothetical protein